MIKNINDRIKNVLSEYDLEPAVEYHLRGDLTTLAEEVESESRESERSRIFSISRKIHPEYSAAAVMKMHREWEATEKANRVNGQ